MESRLTEAQKKQYDEFVKKQEREKEEQKQKAERAKAAYDQAREKHPHLVKNYDPPARVRDPHLKRLAVIAQNERQNATDLERIQIEDRVRMLEKLDQQREKQEKFRDNAQQTTRRPARQDFARAAGREKQSRADPDPERSGPRQDSALSRAFEKARAQEQARQKTRTRTQDQEHGQSRERGRH